MIDIKNLPAKINKEEMDFWTGKSANGEPEIREQIITQLTMSDYDWMQYEILGEVPLQGRKIMSVKFMYSGFNKSEMLVKMDNEEVHYEFPSEIFNKYLQQYLEDEIKAIHGEFAFYGGDIILSFYEAVMACDEKEEVQDPE